ncbi:autotransporter domain-containing protein [Bradyrhizobium sp. BR 10261]|uniref:autotransporter outer membrane beta-barrel domain-containing protein n=1 Tax=Bradyrhizobium sp. BR 10261 TaxID=2749992 RepID=UPI001C646AB8|nr:autotransporter domain-containing protein [Bradyrhizobium sp. BR 10261]MBW7962157.1 autotransporter domain-containing protein [Bradyrhizobium sp. BR 10261]
MKTGKDCFKAGSRLRAALLTSSALALAWALPAGPSRAASNGTWLASPTSNDYGNGANWDGGFVPPATASFGASNTTSLAISSASVGGWTFNAGASNYVFNVNNELDFTGAGITVNGGSATIINKDFLQFFGNSTAGTASITNNSFTVLFFNINSTAGDATITNDVNGTLSFYDASTAGSATITNSGNLRFFAASTAGNATLINNAGGSVDFSLSTGPNGDGRLSAGSIAGAGAYNLGANELTVGSNNASTEVTGIIWGAGGSLVKTGTGILTLSGANSYTGGTTINGGTLQLGSAGGVGSIVGTVNVGASGTFSVFNADTSGITSISNGGHTFFQNASSASSATITNGGVLKFNDTSTAGAATITNSGNLIFSNSSSGGSATIISNNNRLYFYDTSTAGSANITNSGMSIADFFDNATAGNATITNGYYLFFLGNSTAGNAVITNNNYLSFEQNSTADHATLTNTGSLVFFHNSTAGSATITNSNVLAFRDGSTAGSAVITNNAGGTTSFRENSTAGNAQLINNAANAVFDFSGSTGPNGDHKLSAGSIAGNGIFRLGANELTVGGNNSSTAVSGVIADGGAYGGAGGSLVKTGTGTLTLSGTNTYTGGTTFAGGTVSVSSDADLGDLAGSLTFKGGTLQISGTTFTTTARTITLGVGGGTLDIADATNNFVISQNLSGGALTKSGAGALSLAGAANLSALTIATGTLAFIGNATAGNTTITNNAYLKFGDTSTAGGATISNNSLLTFADSATAGGATINNNGGLGFTNGATAGNAIISNSGNVVFTNASTPGNARLTNTTSGAVFGFITRGLNGDGKISAGSIAGNGRFNLNGAELTVGGNNLSTNVIGVLTGDGSMTGTSLVKVGAGTLTLSGINTYIGATIVNGGTLAVNGSIASSSSLTVNTGGTLSGTGTVGNTTIASGGTLAPGNSVGTLTVSGNLAFGAGSFYRVEVSTTTADRTNVSGTATLTGATVQAVAIPGSFRSQTYTILNASGGLGGTQFAGLSVSGSFSPARNPHLTYDPNNVYLVLDPGAIVLPAVTGANQSNVAGAINGAVAGGGTPPAGFDALLNLGQPQLNHGLSQVSGQPGAAGTQAAFNATQQFVGMLDPFGGGGTDGERGASAGDGGTLGYASTAPDNARVREAYAAVTPRGASGEIIDRRWGVWASGYGGASTLNGNAAAGSTTTTSHIYGTVVGADYRVSPNTLLGFALGGAGYNFTLSDSLGGGRADLFQAGFYGRHTFGPAYLSAALAYGWQDVTTDRTVTVSGTDKLTANFKASTFSGRLEGGWRFAPIPASTFGVTPYAAAQVTTFHLPGYGESAIVGSNQFALSYSAQDTTNVRTELGARTDQRFLVSDGVLTLRGRLAWAHDTNTNRLVSAAFQTLPGAAFTVSGAQPAADSALVGGRAEMKWKNGFSLVGTVEGEFSQSTQTYTGKGTVRYEW